MKSVTVYCASSSRIDPVYFEVAERLGSEFVRENVRLIYGGGSTGLMGKIADTVIEGNGTVRGVIPRFMQEIEWSHPGVAEMIMTETMHERKEKLLEDTDAVIALPGGTGTLEELLEVISMKRLGLFDKPIAILNTKNFYDPLKEMLEKCVSEQFMKEKHLAMWAFFDTPEEIFPYIEQAGPWDAYPLV